MYRIETEITEQGSRLTPAHVPSSVIARPASVAWRSSTTTLPTRPAASTATSSRKTRSEQSSETFRDRLFTEIFPGRIEVPKTLIFAKDDSHADDIVQIVREEFGKGNDFAAKITYQYDGQEPEDLLAEFRNCYNPRIAVTVDMIATGTDVKPWSACSSCGTSSPEPTSSR